MLLVTTHGQPSVWRWFLFAPDSKGIPADLVPLMRMIKFAVDKAVKRKVDGAAEACRDQGIVFPPIAVETLGGMHRGTVQQVKQLAAALARHTGQEESTTTSHLFKRFSLNLMRGNSVMLTTRVPHEDFPQAQVDGAA